jgi:hypothetical protein
MANDNEELVRVPVPRRHLGPVYGLIAKLEGALLEEAPEPPAEVNQEAPRNGAATSWTPELVRRAYVESPPAMMRVLDKLAANPEAEIVSDELAAAIGPGKGWPNLAGTLGAFGRRTKSRYKQGSWPFRHRWDHGLQKMVYAMPKDVAEIIRSS